MQMKMQEVGCRWSECCSPSIACSCIEATTTAAAAAATTAATAAAEKTTGSAAAIAGTSSSSAARTPSQPRQHSALVLVSCFDACAFVVIRGSCGQPCFSSSRS